MTESRSIEKMTVDTIRTLSMDAVQAANSGHPGAPMAMAPVAYCLWQRFLRYDPKDPGWPNRDRFVLSAGHGSMLLYSLLHLTGVRALGDDDRPTGAPAMPMEEIKRFRQLHSRTPGHPEFGLTSGVETTTGPLGQGAAVSVGMAIAGRWLAARYNRPDLALFDYDVYALLGDGCVMEGITGEAASLAGHQKLSKLCWIYDNNSITIEGKTALAFSEDVATRFVGYGWNVTRVADANDLAMLERAFRTFQATSDRPTLIIVDSHIGFGSPRQDSHKAHGEPLGEDGVRESKRTYGWPEDQHFLVPPEVPKHFEEGLGARGGKLRAEWEKLFEKYRGAHPEEAKQLETMRARELPADWDRDIPSFDPDAKGLATRVSSGKVLNGLAKNLPWLIGGSADLAPSTKTLLDGEEGLQAGTPGGRNMHFGIREHAMGAILNGLSHCRLRPYGAGFLIFSDYMRPPTRLAALMELPVVYVFTHDSIGVGEDGPTHQPIEQLAALRAIPGLLTIRPCDANEVVEAWRLIAGLKDEPAALALTRQNVPTLDRSRFGPAQGLRRGGYVLADAPDGKPDVLLLATGSEVQWCVEAIEPLKKDGIAARVVSMPCWELFDRQERKYRDQVLPPSVTARVAIEQGATLGWDRYVGLEGRVIGMHSFGASAPADDVRKEFGFDTDNVVETARQLVRGKGR